MSNTLLGHVIAESRGGDQEHGTEQEVRKEKVQPNQRCHRYLGNIRKGNVRKHGTVEIVPFGDLAGNLRILRDIDGVGTIVEITIDSCRRTDRNGLAAELCVPSERAINRDCSTGRLCRPTDCCRLSDMNIATNSFQIAVDVPIDDCRSCSDGDITCDLTGDRY